MPWEETFDVGVDTRSPVDDNDYQVPFRFTGKLALLATNNFLRTSLNSGKRNAITHAAARPTALDHKSPFRQLVSHDRGESLHIGGDYDGEAKGF